jgi:hypothetical protein
MIAVLTHRTGELCLDKDFVLIEGHPAMMGSAMERSAKGGQR